MTLMAVCALVVVVAIVFAVKDVFDSEDEL